MKLLLLSLALGVTFATLLVNDDVVEKREAEGCVCTRAPCNCIGGGGKREATEEVVVEKRETEEKKCSLNCHATDCFYLPRGCVPTEDKKREAEKREVAAGCSRVCSFTSPWGCKEICSREAAEAYDVCTCNSASSNGASNGGCERCTANGCEPVSNCNVKREAGCSRVCSFTAPWGCKDICSRDATEEVAVEKREAEGCVCVGSPCVVPAGCPHGKREATEEVVVEKREEKKCSLNCHATDCFYLPRGCVPTEDKKREAVECQCVSRPCMCPAIGRARRMTLE